MSTFKPGDRINITIEDAKVTSTGHDDLGRAFIEYTHGEYNSLATVDRDDPTVNVALGAPAEWPPRPGDLWRDQHGAVWFAADLVDDVEETGSPAIYMLAAHGDHQVVPDRCNENYGPLTLVHREDEQIGQTGGSA